MDIVVSPKHLIEHEILSVTSSMRKNSRWASSARLRSARDAALASSMGLRRASMPDSVGKGHEREDVDLMAGFDELKRIVRDAEDVMELPLTDLLAPFLSLIRSSLSTGPIASAALMSLHTFFMSGLIRPSSVLVGPALANLSNTVANCKFEASDSAGDEAVLLRIISVIKECMCGSVGYILGDVEVCEMLETLLTICCQMRASEVLRRSAELHMHAVVRKMFSRLNILDPEQEENKMRREPSNGDVKMSVAVVNTRDEGLLEESTTPPQQSEVNHGPISEVSEKDDLNPAHPVPQMPATVPPYGLPSITELLRVLVNLLNPMDQQHTESTRILSLRILNTALEVSGIKLGDYPSLSSIIFDHGCKYLFQLARSESPTVLFLSLRVISTLFETLRPHLKLQQELFLSITIDRLAFPPSDPQRLPLPSKRVGSPSLNAPSPNPSLAEDAGSEIGTRTPPLRVTVTPAKGDTRELMLEILNSISRNPSFMVDLWSNYDCDLNCEDLFERLIAFLTRGVLLLQNAAPIDRQQQTGQLLCLDLVLTFVNHMTARMEGEGLDEKWPTTNAPRPDDLMSNKSQKRLILAGASRFNIKPKEGIQFFKENGLIATEEDGVVGSLNLATFLKNCPRLDKKLLGDFLSRPENRDVLDAFIRLFDFKNKTIADAMRDLLEAFRLPGEAQQIERITETFAKCYFSSEPEGIKSEDAVFVLAYSVIMLNTDLHNPQVRKRMTFEDYQRNLRGVNAGSDFDPNYLRAVYDSIGKREIVMPEEHTGQVGFEHAWKELLQRARTAGNFVVCNTSIFDKLMFTMVWRPVITAISYAFTSFDDDYVIQRAISGFRQCATLAGTFELPEVFDYIVQSLSPITTLLHDSGHNTAVNHPVVEIEGREITVSTLSVKFGNNIRAQLAAVVLFTIANGNGNAVREGWSQIFEMFETLFLHALLPTRMLQMEDFLGGVSMIPMQGSQPSPPRVPRGDGGLLSALSSYLLTPYGAGAEPSIPEATEAQVESTLCTIDCITACKLDELYSQIVHLDLSSLIAALRALHTIADRRTVDRLATISPEGPEEGVMDVRLPYDPASIFLLEMMVSIACQTPLHIEDIWPVVFEHLSALLRSAIHYSMLLIERAVVGLLRLCLIVADKSSMRDQLYVALDSLGGLPPPVLNAVAEQVVAGLAMVVQGHRDAIKSQTEWSLVFSLLRRTVSHPEASKMSFDLLQGLASDGPPGSVTTDNYTGLIAVLDDFATIAGTIVEGQGQNRSGGAIASEAVAERGVKAIDIISDLKRFIPQLLEVASVSAGNTWKLYTLPLLISLGHQATNTNRDVRHNAMAQLQRILLGPYINQNENDHTQVEEMFNRVVFPLLDDLLKPEVFRRDPKGMPETRLRASALLCKVFLHYEMHPSQYKSDIRVLWIQILDLLDRLMNIDKRDPLYEAVPESLKNVLLVMNASDILVPPSEPDPRNEHQKSMWAATQERIDRFIPGFLNEVINSSPATG